MRLTSQIIDSVIGVASAVSADVWPASRKSGGVRDGVGRPLVGALEWFGGFGEFFGRLAKAVVTPPFEWRELLRQMDELGAKSLPLIALAGAAIGVVSSLRTRESLETFGAKSMLPALIILSIIKETGPIITALVASGRLGAGLGAELGSMKVTEQIDAIEASAVNPYKFLAAPRVVACVLMLPLLTIVSDFFGIITGWLTTALAEPVTFKLFLNYGLEQTTFRDFLPSTCKAFVFGFIIGMVGCFQGMRARGGTKGVGRASTSAVVLSSLFVILADVVLVRLIMTVFEK
jgi:phospholipid/cholesterol/gamma-HCH transport system permease protein